ncbi:MAG: DNA repair protein RadC [Acetobacter sp.]|nr:DNA repair protein RadC [Acetobacter sp.]MBR2123674.1 DNA repair protein RadC [Acetobacter sp.]
MPIIENHEAFSQSKALLASVLEAVLPSDLPQAQKIADHLLAETGSLSTLLTASGQETDAVKRQSEIVRVMLLLVRESVQRFHRDKLYKQPLLAKYEQVFAYLQSVMGYEKTEQVRVLFLDENHYLLRDEITGQGTVDQAPVYPRELVYRALQLGASGLVLVHNHPSGNPNPSQADIVMTKKVIAAARVVGLTVWDHVIVGTGQMMSMKEEGLL